jgi:hypothetical protein
MTSPLHHSHFVASLVDLVRSEGASDALATVRADRPAFADGAYHDTRAVFFVWAVDRLVSAGLTRTQVLWHPLVHADSPLAWWPTEVLDSSAARHGFVAPTGLADGEPAPAEPTTALAAA